jgi:carbonic anhydrase
MSHICDAIVVCCIDFRFQKFIRNWIDKNLKNRTYDLVGFAGSTKDLKTVLRQIDISVRLHYIKRVVLIHHEECGAYGTDSTPERHSKDLRKSRKEIFKRYPNLKVNLYYLLLNGRFQKIK